MSEEPMKCKCGKSAVMLVCVMGKSELLCQECWQEGVDEGKRIIERFKKTGKLEK